MLAVLCFTFADFTCDAGEYLDIKSDQECHKCPAGHFSLGGGVLYNEWTTLPVQFSSRTDSFSTSVDVGIEEKRRCKE
jgi:hypothetical protein